MTTLKRVNHYRYLIFVGNGNGIIGYGKGRGLDYEGALLNAYKEAKKNLIAVPTDPFMTFPYDMNFRHNEL